MTEQDLVSALHKAIDAHRDDVKSGKCDKASPSPAVLTRHRAVADASLRLTSWRAVRDGDGF